MTTAIILNEFCKEFPIVIGLNKTGDFANPPSPIKVLDEKIIGDVYDKDGGSWCAVNDKSIFAFITLQKSALVRSPTKDQKEKELPKNIVLDCLKYKSISDVLSFVEDFNPTKSYPFNLVFGNQEKIYVAHSYLIHSMVIKEIPKGMSVITDDFKFSGATSVSQYTHAKLDNLKSSTWLDFYKSLKKVLAAQDAGIKISPKASNSDGELVGIATKSSSVLAFSNDGLSRYKFFDRSIIRPKVKEGEPVPPRYVDYIDIWREFNNIQTSNSTDEELEDLLDKEKSPKEIIKDLLKEMHAGR